MACELYLKETRRRKGTEKGNLEGIVRAIGRKLWVDYPRRKVRVGVGEAAMLPQ